MNLVATLGMENNNPNFHAKLVLFCTNRRNQIFLVCLDGKTRDMVLNNELIQDPVNNNLGLSKFRSEMVSYDTKYMGNPFVCIHQCKARHKQLGHILTLY